MSDSQPTKKPRPALYTDVTIRVPLLVTLIVTAVGLTAVRWFGLDGMAGALGVSCGFMVFFVIRARLGVTRRVGEAMRAERELHRRLFQQIDALISLVAVLQPRSPLPATRGFAASPDLLRVILTEVLVTRPSLVVEASSGVSTLVIASALKQIGAGRVVSMEHEPQYAEQTRALLKAHGVEGFATVIDAPLVPVRLDVPQFEKREWQWYDVSRLRLDGRIDLFVIDGPPKDLQRFSRFPALPILWDHLRAGARIILDDGSRPDERAAVDVWRAQFPELAVDFLDLEKGAFVMRKGLPVADRAQLG